MNIKKALFVIVILILLFLAAPAVHVGSTDAGGLPMSTTAAPMTVLQPEPTTTIDLSFLDTTTSTTVYTPPTVLQYRNTEVPPSDRWDKLAICESNGNWSYPPVVGGFSGGIMFHIGTWRSMGGEEFAPDAYLASREQQIIIAERVLATSGWRAWPGCSRKFGWI